MSKITEVINDIISKINDKVSKTDNETIAGVKTFSLSPIVPTPTTGTQVTNKAYVDTKAPLASPAFTGTPTAPTASVGTNTTQLATTAFVNSEISNDVGVANSSLVKTALNASGTAPVYACRAWVNFNGTGTVAIGASGNVSSITDNGTGDYTVNFSTAMPDANYSVVSGSQAPGVVGSSYLSILSYNSSSTSYVRFSSYGSYPHAGVNDKGNVSVAVFR